MEAAASVASSRGVSLPMPSLQSSRKEWRAVSEHPVGNSVDEDLERSKLGQLDERLIYEQPADVDFCSITIDGSLDNEILQQRLHTVMKQRVELQQIETGLQAQLIARSEIMGLQNSYDSQIKEHVNATVKIQEQLREREHTIHELERKIEEGQRELHAIRLDTEAVWAKDDLLREQNKELATFRRERDNSEAERAQHLEQIHDLQEHIQEKEHQFMELQHRVAQETVIFKDDQLREAQAWITRVQEMDALQTSTNQTLQAELRDRTEQYNQLWMGCQRQIAELVHTIQMLQIELADARERSGSFSDESHACQSNSKDASQFGQGNGGHLDVSGNGKTENSEGLPNGNVENVSSAVSKGNASGLVGQTNHVPSVPIAPHSLVGMPTFLPPGQVAAMHPFVMHQQGLPQSVPAHLPQSHAGHFHSVPAISALQHWQNQQAVSEGLQMPMHNQYTPSQSEHSLLRPDSNYDYEVSGNGQYLRPEYIDAHSSQGVQPHAVVPSSNEGGQVQESLDKSYMVDPQPQQNMQQISSQFHDALKLDSLEHNSETEEKNVTYLARVDAQGSVTEQPNLAANTSEAPINIINFSEKTAMNNASVTLPPEAFVSNEEMTKPGVGKGSEITLLDRESLLGCIVRTIPPNGRIRISSTLPNRLGKMLTPLHWHDYKKNYGKLDDFVAGHPELFVIEGDYIQLREGAQEIIAATAAFAKVKAAASATSLYSSLLPSVAVTPMAQSHRLKKAPSMDSKSGRPEQTLFREHATSTPGNTTDNHSQLLAMQTQHSNGVTFAVGRVKILSKPKDLVELNGPETRTVQSAMHSTAGNGASRGRSDLVSSQSRGSIQGRENANFSVKQQGRSTGTSLSSRR